MLELNQQPEALESHSSHLRDKEIEAQISADLVPNERDLGKISTSPEDILPLPLPL